MTFREKPRFQQKSKPPVYFNLDFDPQKITIKTQIPQLPEKYKSKPDQKNHQKKIKQLEQKLESLKKERKIKKSEYSKSGVGYEQEIKTLQTNIELGNKCHKILQSDILDIESNVSELDAKIKKKYAYIRKLQRGPEKDSNANNQKKQYENMTYQQLDQLLDKLGVRISTAQLTKKQETQINALITKLNRLKMKAPHGQPITNNDDEIQENQLAVDRLKQIKKKQQSRISEIRYKIECIKEDIENFEDQLVQIEEKKKNPEVLQLKEEAQSLKNQIYQVREQIAEQKQAFIDKKTEYEYQQKKIQWIKFASSTKQQRLKQWEEEKAERRRKKQYDQKKQKSEQTKQGTQNKQPTYKPRPNRHQRQIDACEFLIKYCEDLYPKTKTQTNQQNKQQKTEDLEVVLKKGQWATEKGIQILKPKKVDQSNTEIQNNTSYRRKKNKRQTEQQNPQNNSTQSKLVHTVFIEHLFDNVKCVAPSTIEQLGKLIQQLRDKQEYYLQHPEEVPAGEKNNDRNDRNSYERVDRQKYTAEKYAKAKNNQHSQNNQNKRIINTEDFPRLS